MTESGDGAVWSEQDLARLALSATCRDLADQARAQVPTASDGHLSPGVLVEEAAGLMSAAQRALELAVTAERTRGTAWSEIGERLGVTRQTAHVRFAPRVAEILETILFPVREGAEGGLGWSACPEGLEDPDATARRLDEWVARHHESCDGPLAENAVSAKLMREPQEGASAAITLSAKLANRLINGRLPQGVSERAAVRMLLEAKLRAYTALAGAARSRAVEEAARTRDEVFDELVEWHRADVRGRLTWEVSDGGGTVRLDGKAVQHLALCDRAPIAPEDRGWFLWELDSDGEMTGEGCRFVAEAVVAVQVAASAALDLLAGDIASDYAKGYRPPRRGAVAAAAGLDRPARRQGEGQ